MVLCAQLGLATLFMHFYCPPQVGNRRRISNTIRKGNTRQIITLQQQDRTIVREVHRTIVREVTKYRRPNLKPWLLLRFSICSVGGHPTPRQNTPISPHRLHPVFLIVDIIVLHPLRNRKSESCWGHIKRLCGQIQSQQNQPGTNPDCKPQIRRRNRRVQIIIVRLEF